MKKLVTLASAGVFLLSLQGASLAQDKTPAPRPPAAPPAATLPLPPRRKPRRPLKTESPRHQEKAKMAKKQDQKGQ